jgi:hypothetical protein
MPTPLHSQTREINGRVYRIEVARSGREWRARVVSRYGGTTALMPFYGSTPDEAAQSLARWLSRAHQTASGTSAG